MGDARPLQGLLPEWPLQLAHQGEARREGAGEPDRHQDPRQLRRARDRRVRVDAGDLRHAQPAAAGLELLHARRRDDPDRAARPPAVAHRERPPVLRSADGRLGLPAGRQAAALGQARVGGGGAQPARHDEPHRWAHRPRPERCAPLQSRPADRRGGHLGRCGGQEGGRLVVAMGRWDRGAVPRPPPQRRPRRRRRGAREERRQARRGQGGPQGRGRREGQPDQ
mmetsp:Transcript_23445/g.59656  ORF Transcript_23445/g.59656 Transcript_23445/m.59656 type:complete len:224 (+) Transcript_23445:607-1278(+)